jgi:hypothetical protein
MMAQEKPKGWWRAPLDALAELADLVRIHDAVPAPRNEWEARRRAARSARRHAAHSKGPMPHLGRARRRRRPKQQRRDQWVMRWKTLDGEDVVVRGGGRPAMRRRW